MTERPDGREWRVAAFTRKGTWVHWIDVESREDGEETIARYRTSAGLPDSDQRPRYRVEYRDPWTPA